MTEQEETHLEKTILKLGIWPSDEAKAERKYSACVRHMRHVIDDHSRPRWWETFAAGAALVAASLFMGFAVGHIVSEESARNDKAAELAERDAKDKHEAAKNAAIEEAELVREKRLCKELGKMFEISTKFTAARCWSYNKHHEAWQTERF